MKTSHPTLIHERLTSLREKMVQEGIAAYIIPSNDPHSGEYVPAYWEGRKWISGFTGSAGTLVVTLHEAALWTDSRYFLQASEQLAGTGISLMKDRLPETPTLAQWISQQLTYPQVVGINGWTTTISDYQSLTEGLKEAGLTLKDSGDLLAEIWHDRPILPQTPVEILPLSFAGQSAPEKLTALREQLQAKGHTGMLVTALDEIAWLLNLRGKDVHCNPVFVSYLFITAQHTYLYIEERKMTDELAAYLSGIGVEARIYGRIEFDLTALKAENLLLPPSTNFRLYHILTHVEQVTFTIDTSPILLMKAIKNPTEIAGFKTAMEKDGVAMVRFWMWLEKAIQTELLTESDICDKLETYRAEQPHFKGISFDTIAGYAANGAIVHYKPEPHKDLQLAPKGLLLLDSGAQYLEGTTDITRTFALGPLTEEERNDYTLVLKGMIAVSRIRFPIGTCGTQLDVLARQFMWEQGINYGHGTGHGVGHYLNVHEGPHQIRMNHVPTPLQAGMTLTNEPGIYRAGSHGVRIENTMLVIPGLTTEFGEFLKFEPLTLCPIDTRPIRTDLLNKEETDWLNHYHQLVYNRLSPYLNDTEKTWLAQATQPI